MWLGNCFLLHGAVVDVHHCLREREGGRRGRRGGRGGRVRLLTAARNEKYHVDVGQFQRDQGKSLAFLFAKSTNMRVVTKSQRRQCPVLSPRRLQIRTGIIYSYSISDICLEISLGCGWRHIKSHYIERGWMTAEMLEISKHFPHNYILQFIMSYISQFSVPREDDEREE